MIAGILDHPNLNQMRGTTAIYARCMVRAQLGGARNHLSAETDAEAIGCQASPSRRSQGIFGFIPTNNVIWHQFQVD